MEKGIQVVFARESSAYATFTRPLTDIQLRVLRALAISADQVSASPRHCMAKIPLRKFRYE